jgi:hypothetical protein
MKTRALTLAATLGVTLAGGTLYAQYPPPPSDPGPYGQPQQPYDQGNYQGNDQGYGDPQGYDQGYDDQQPYYDPQPDGNYDDPRYASPQPAYTPDLYSNGGSVDESVFYGELSPYGRWLQRGSYGWVWEPTRVAVGWRPYTQGHWVNTDYGWTWISSEPWGWATYHYGRWLLDPQYGWLWVPGNQWGPAWVSFQQGGGYIGWAPLPPSVGFSASVGIRIGGFSLSASIDPYAYSFVPERSFLQERVAAEILPPARNVTFVRNTTNITNITVVNNRVVNQSVPVQRIEQVTGQRVRRYQLAETRNPAQGRIAQVQGDRVSIFRPGATLAAPRPSVTPQQVIQRRQQRLQQYQPGRAGRPINPADQPGRAQRGDRRFDTAQPTQPTQPGQPAGPVQQVQPGQQQPGRQPRISGRTFAPRPTQSPEEVDRRYQEQQRQLQARQDAERNRLQQDQQRNAPPAPPAAQRPGNRNPNAPNLSSQNQEEQRALQQQQQREQQQLEARRQRERQAAQAQPQRQPRQQPQQQQNQQQNRNRDDRKDRNDKQREQKPEPPPPSV